MALMGEPRQETRVSFCLSPRGARGAADGGQGLFGAPSMHCSWRATAPFQAWGMIPESRTRSQFNKGISSEVKGERMKDLDTF